MADQSMCALVLGSCTEGIYLKQLLQSHVSEECKSKWADILLFKLARGVSISTKQIQKKNEYVTNEIGCHPGYLNLTQNSIVNGMMPILMHPSKRYLIDSKEQKRKLTSSPEEYAVNLVLITPSYCIKCHWPESAMEWKSRERYEQWPSEEVISQVVRAGCLVVPQAHVLSSDPQSEWQYSFYQAEQILFSNAVTPDQRYCFVVSRFLCYRQFQDNDSFEPQFLKNIFLYACERIPGHRWQSSPGSCILYLIDELILAFYSGTLMNYFMPANNMIDFLTRDQRYRIIDDALLLRTNLDKDLLQLHNIISEKGVTVSPRTVSIILADAKRFANHRSATEATRTVIVPVLVEQAHQCINAHQYAQGFELVNEAFEKRLSVSTCNNLISLELMLQNVVEGLSLNDKVWFCTYADKQCGSQVSATLTHAVCSQLDLVFVHEVLPEDIAGPFHDSNVPKSLTQQFPEFCHDYAAFLYLTGHHTDSLSVLKHCHAQYIEHLPCPTMQDTSGFTPNTMFSVYYGMYYLFLKRGQRELFCEYLHFMDTVADHNDDPDAQVPLAFIHMMLGDTSYAQRQRQSIARSFEGFGTNFSYEHSFSWPRRYLVK